MTFKHLFMFLTYVTLSNETTPRTEVQGGFVFNRYSFHQTLVCLVSPCDILANSLV